jgi:hypothetical protein
MVKKVRHSPLRFDPYLGKYVPAPVAAILTDAEKEALEELLRRKQKPKNRTHAEMWLTGTGLYDRAR